MFSVVHWVTLFKTKNFYNGAVPLAFFEVTSEWRRALRETRVLRSAGGGEEAKGELARSGLAWRWWRYADGGDGTVALVAACV